MYQEKNRNEKILQSPDEQPTTSSCQPESLDQFPPPYSPRLDTPPEKTDTGDIIPININIQVVGSRGDVQPFIALGVALKNDGHRVRLSTHAQFRDTVISAGLEFFDIGGDPADLMAFMLDWKTANKASYAAVEMLTWQGLGDIVNEWRTHRLGIEPVPGTEGHRLLDVLEVPFTYCWSSSLVAKPEDWGSHIDVCGFFFRESPEYSPSPELEEFLRTGPPPVYIGFGSIVASGSESLMTTVLAAVRTAGVRAIISQGWSNLGGDNTSDVFFITDCPHEWLFQKVVAVVHHGGAGTTACGLRFGKPTAIIPFFGDQPFWGSVIAKAGAGPEPIAYRSLTSTGLAQAIKFCLTDEAAEAAGKIAEAMRTENGVAAAVQSFYKHLPFDKMKCDFYPNQPAALACGRGNHSVKMCKAVASVLVKNQRLEMKKLSLYRANPLAIENIRWDPFTAVSAAAVSTLLGMISDTVDIVVKPIQARQHRQKQEGYLLVDGIGDEVQNVTLEPVTTSIQDTPSFAMLPLGDSTQSSRLQNVLRSVTSDHAIPTMPEVSVSKSVLGGMGRLAGNTTKGILVDMPLALTEGFRAIPKLYGDPMSNHDSVHDFRSGVSVAGKRFCEGISGSVTDIFTHTYHGKMEQGAAGAAMGLAKGTASFVAKCTSATLGLISYPAQGVYRSIWMKTHEPPLQQMLAAKLVEGDWLVSEESRWNRDRMAIIEDFVGLRSARK
ncbi:udp-glucose,sterol transferase [Fusarium flagelliforme]|uniref:Udp-glucose,sterol transferase n=1 Tax=Fusarium flagelliforme TaxID=2675880 RepID=A0A395MYK5_9HYPO|nr:udp-glucose,sterol transferase [Fusarium flagelliforme]